MDRDFSQSSGILALWTGVLLAPVAFFVQFGANFILVPWACAFQWKWLLLLVTVVALAAAAVSGWVSYGNWQHAGREWPDEAAGVIPRSRFLAFVGLLLSAMFFLAILAQGIANLILGACQ